MMQLGGFMDGILWCCDRPMFFFWFEACVNEVDPEWAVKNNDAL